MPLLNYQLASYVQSRAMHVEPRARSIVLGSLKVVLLYQKSLARVSPDTGLLCGAPHKRVHGIQVACTWTLFLPSRACRR